MSSFSSSVLPLPTNNSFISLARERQTSYYRVSEINKMSTINEKINLFSKSVSFAPCTNLEIETSIQRLLFFSLSLSVVESLCHKQGRRHKTTLQSFQGIIWRIHTEILNGKVCIRKGVNDASRKKT